MLPLKSALENQVERFDRVREVLTGCNFTVGGNWDYDHGYFDRSLDDADKVWLRLPFRVVDGNLDPDVDLSDATVELGSPFVLRHLYNEGVDKQADSGAFSGLVNQFQEPIDEDATLEKEWIDKAHSVLNEVEQRYFG